MLLNTSTFHFRHSTCCRAACSSADQDPRHFSMSCPNYLHCSGLTSFTPLPSASLEAYSTLHPWQAGLDRASLGDFPTWPRFRKGTNCLDGRDLLWAASIVWKHSCMDALKGSTERKTVIISPSSTAVHLNFTLTRRGGRGKLWPPGLAASAS